MLSVRLPEELERRISEAVELEKKSKSFIIRKALEEYLSDREAGLSAYELGKDLFGKRGSDMTDLSKTYKERIKENLREKHSH